jgi:hypothetical protein
VFDEGRQILLGSSREGGGDGAVLFFASTRSGVADIHEARRVAR